MPVKPLHAFRATGCLRILAVLLGWAVLCGCGGRGDVEDRAEDARRQRDVEQREAYLRSLRVTVEDSEVLEMVRVTPAEDSDGDTEAWLKRQINALEGTVLFPRWKVRRQGSGICEVTYTYTLIDENNEMVKKGWAWKVDTALNFVSSPSTLEDDVSVTHPDGAARDKRVSEAEWSLE